MTLEALTIVLLVGGVAGWLATLAVGEDPVERSPSPRDGGSTFPALPIQSLGFATLGDIVTGIAGAFAGAWLLPRVGILLGGAVIGAILNAFIGAVVALVLFGFIRRAATPACDR